MHLAPRFALYGWAHRNPPNSLFVLVTLVHVPLSGNMISPTFETPRRCFQVTDANQVYASAEQRERFIGMSDEIDSRSNHLRQFLSETMTNPKGSLGAIQICPTCSTTLQEQHCKLVCPRCGYFLSCSDFH